MLTITPLKHYVLSEEPDGTVEYYSVTSALPGFTVTFHHVRVHPTFGTEIISEIAWDSEVPAIKYFRDMVLADQAYDETTAPI